MKKNAEYMLEHAGLCRAADRLEPQMFDEYGVQRGLRDKNGNGVVAGLTNISRIESFKMEDGKRYPVKVSCGIAVMTVSNWSTDSAGSFRIRRSGLFTFVR